MSGSLAVRLGPPAVWWPDSQHPLMHATAARCQRNSLWRLIRVSSICGTFDRNLPATTPLSWLPILPPHTHTESHTHRISHTHTQNHTHISHTHTISHRKRGRRKSLYPNPWPRGQSRDFPSSTCQTIRRPEVPVQIAPSSTQATAVRL